MDKINKVIASIVGIFTVVDIILRYAKIPDLSFLTSPLITINPLEIIILLVVIMFIHRFLPEKLYRIYLQKRSEKFWNNWKKFKALLLENKRARYYYNC